MESSARRIDLLLFDLDGTLIDSRTDIASGINYTLKSLGLRQKEPGRIISYIGKGVANLVERSLGPEHRGLLDKALPVFENYFRTHYADTSRLYPGSIEVLEHFKCKKKAVVTNRNHEFAVLSMKALGIFEYFEAISGGDDVVCSKPSSCPIDNILKRFGVNKNRTMMIGDMGVDVEAGRDAGVVTCAVTYGFGKKEDIEKMAPDYIIESIKELEHIAC